MIVAPLLPLASAHGVCVQLQPRFGRLDAVSISNQSIQTGDTITITGNITSLVKKDLQGYLSIHSSPSPHARWAVMSTEPSGKMINVTQFSKVPFSMTIKALQPGTYKLSPMLYLPDIGPAFGMLNGCNNAEPVVTVTGKSICNTGFVSVLKAEDGSSFCVKPDTAQKLIERGWATADGANQSVLSSSQIQVNQTAASIPPCVSKIPNQYAIAGGPGWGLCPIAPFGSLNRILNATGFYGIYNYTAFPDTQNFVLEPGHNGTITVLISLKAVQNFDDTQGRPNEFNITNDVIFQHDAGMRNHPGVDVWVKPKSEMIENDKSSVVTIVLSASKSALPGNYWVSLPPGFCEGGKSIVLTINNCTK